MGLYLFTESLASNVIGLPITNFLRKLLVGKYPNPSKPDRFGSRVFKLALPSAYALYGGLSFKIR